MAAKPDAHAGAEHAAPKQGGKLNLIILIVLALLGTAGGAATPILLMGGPSEKDKAKEEEAKKAAVVKVFVTFGEAAVNLAEDKLTRYIKVKVILVVEAQHEKELNDAINKNRAILRGWLISYLSDKTLADVRGAAGQNRARREIQDHFNSLLFTDGSEKIRDVLFEDWLVQ